MLPDYKSLTQSVANGTNSTNGSSTNETGTLTPLETLLQHDLFLANLVTTSSALSIHLIVFYAIFQIFYKQQGLTSTLIWSLSTILLQAYSLVLSFASAPLQITLIYLKTYVQLLDMALISLGAMSLLLTGVVGATATDSTA